MVNFNAPPLIRLCSASGELLCLPWSTIPAPKFSLCKISRITVISAPNILTRQHVNQSEVVFHYRIHRYICTVHTPKNNRATRRSCTHYMCILCTILSHTLYTIYVLYMHYTFVYYHLSYIYSISVYPLLSPCAIQWTNQLVHQSYNCHMKTDFVYRFIFSVNHTEIFRANRKFLFPFFTSIICSVQRLLQVLHSMAHICQTLAFLNTQNSLISDNHHLRSFTYVQ